MIEIILNAEQIDLLSDLLIHHQEICEDDIEYSAEHEMEPEENYQTDLKLIFGIRSILSKASEAIGFRI